MATQDIFENLVADITSQVLQQVGQSVQKVATDAVNGRVQNLIDSNIIHNLIEEKVNQSISTYRPDMSMIDQEIQNVVAQMGNNISANMNEYVNKMISDKLNTFDFTNLLVEQIGRRIDNENTHYPFPDQSISSTSIDTNGLSLTGDHITGGVIKNFGSTGVDDQATECKVTILDQGTVFENTLYAPRIEVKGGALIDGDLEIQGNIVDSPAYRKLVSDVTSSTQTVITDDVLKQHQNLVFDRIKEEGIDLNKVTFNGRNLIIDDRLVGIVNSQLRTVGTLQDLQTSGETLLSQTLYSASKRVGINTMDPKTALSVWDEEIEISIGKMQQGTGRISTERENELVLGTNYKNNLTLKTDGSVAVDVLQINNMTFTSSQTPPTHDAKRGTVVFNENPNLGGPLGWVSLGDARWANFGIID
jgi:hypothetical protein